MHTLLLRLAAPLQSWGTSSHFEIRATDTYPSKSGVIGILASALGRRRDDDLSDLTSLEFGIRVDQEGRVLRDFHTISHHKGDKELRYRNIKGGGHQYVTTRYYLADAVFLVGIASEDKSLLIRLEDALKNPVRPLFLGRRSNPPAGQLVFGLREGTVLETLSAEPWHASKWYQKKCEEENKYTGTPTWLRIIVDADSTDKEAVALKDLPLSFNPDQRQHTFRLVKNHQILASVE